MMVMKHNGDKRCPYCLSRRLQVVDYDMADKKYHERLGKFWFKLRCKVCTGECEDINNLDADEKRKAKKEIAV